jgi:drug/metabolite transporter (DMT)-like permease
MAYLTLIAALGAATVAAMRLFQGKPLAALVPLPGRVLAAGFWGIAVYEVLLVLAIGMADEKDVGQVNLLNYLWPIWIVAFGAVLLSDRVRLAAAAAGAAAGFAGIVIAGGPQTFSHPPTNILPHGMALSGGVLWALYSVLLRKWRVSEESTGVAFQFTACAAMAAVIATVRGEWGSAAWGKGSTLFWVLFGGVGPTGLAYYWWEIGMKRGAVQFLAALAYLIPIGSSVLIGTLFSEAMNAGLLPGAALIGVGAYLAHRASRPEPPRSDQPGD